MDNIENIQLKIYPEMIASALQKKELDIYITWYVAHAIMLEIGETNQIIHVEKMRSLLQIILGISEGYAYQKFKVGISKYWNTPNYSKKEPKTKVTGLKSEKTIIEHLDVNIGRCEPFLVPLAYFYSDGGKGWYGLKSLLFGLIAGRHNGTQPIAISTLAKETNISRSTVKRLISANTNLRVYRNLNEIANFSSQEQATMFIFKLMDANDNIKLKPYRTQERDGRWYVYRQMGNSYQNIAFERTNIRTRPRVLNKKTRQNAMSFCDKIYLQQYSAESPPKKHCFTFKENIMHHNIGAAKVWIPHNQAKQNIK